MTHYITIADQARGAFTTFEGTDIDAAFAAAVADLGGHPAIADGFVEDRSTGYSKVWTREIDPRAFWFTVMGHLFAKNDNRDWFIGEDRAEVVASAEDFLQPAVDA